MPAVVFVAIIIPSLPYLASMCLSTDLLIVFQRRRSSARASGSTRRSRWRASRSSFFQPSNRLASRSPSTIAAATAQPGSPAWPQSENRHVAARASMSANDRSRPASASHRPSSRIPGVSRMRPPSGIRWSWRRLVVWRPRASSSRISRTAATSSPASVLTSVDLPTPDDPTNATVAPGRMRARSSSIPRPSIALTTMIVTPTATRLDLEPAWPRGRRPGRPSRGPRPAPPRSPRPARGSARGGAGSGPG